MQLIAAVSKAKANEIVNHFRNRLLLPNSPLWTYVELTDTELAVMTELRNPDNTTSVAAVDVLRKAIDRVVLTDRRVLLLCERLIVQLSVDRYDVVRNTKGPAGVYALVPNDSASGEYTDGA